MHQIDENQSYCRGLVREFDRERYLVTLFAPAQVQRSIWTILSFNQEVAKIRESVSETALGEIRLQWWQEVLEEIQAGSVRQQPVIKELSHLAGNADVWRLLGEVLEARRHDMFAETVAGMNDLETYAFGAGGALHEAMLCANSSEIVTSETRSAVRAGGAAWAMLGLIRALPFHWQSGKSMLPQENDSAMQMRATDEAFEALEPTILNMKSYVEQQLSIAEQFAGKIPKVARFSVLSVSLARLHLKALSRANNNPFEMPPYEVSDLRKIARLMWSQLTGKL